MVCKSLPQNSEILTVFSVYVLFMGNRRHGRKGGPSGQICMTGVCRTLIWRLGG